MTRTTGIRGRRRHRHLDPDAGGPPRSGRSAFRLALLIAICVVAAVFVAWLSWVGARLADASHHLENAQEQLVTLQNHLLEGNQAAATADVQKIQHEAARARAATHGVIVGSAASVPYLGRTPHAARSLSDIGLRLANDTLPRLASAGLALSPNRLRTSGDTIDVAGLQAVSAPLADAVSELADALARLQRVSQGSLVLDPIDHTRVTLTGNLAQVQETAVVANRFARLAPAMLGVAGPRRYFVADVNFNEARGTGGVLGGYQIVVATNGRLKLVGTGSTSTLPQTQAWRDANTGADFADAASKWAALWERAHKGERIDGVLSVDPLALSQIVSVTGPVELANGVSLHANSVVFRVTQRYASAKTARIRDAAMHSVSARVINRVLTGGGDTNQLASRLGVMSARHHLLLWSSHRDEEAVLSEVPIAGAVSERSQPYAGLVINNIGGTKLDTFMRRSVTYFADGCTGKERTTAIVIRLSNDSKSDLAPYLNARTDNPPKGTPDGQGKYSISVYTTAGARLTSATLDGKPVRLTQRSDRGHPVFGLETTINRRGTRILSLRLTEPVLPGQPDIPPEPLLRPQQTALAAPICAGAGPAMS